MDGWTNGWMDGWLNEGRMTEWKWMYHWWMDFVIWFICMRGSEIYFRVSFSLAQLSHNYHTISYSTFKVMVLP